MKVKKLTLMAMLLGIALTIFVVEGHFPPPVPIAGVKLGLANIVTLAAMVWLGRREAFVILILRIVIGSMFVANAAGFLYSLAGGLVCFAVMAALAGSLGQNHLWVVSVFGAIGHNAGQIAMAAVIMRSAAVFAYFPILIVSAVVTGTLTGAAAQILTERISP